MAVTLELRGLAFAYPGCPALFEKVSLTLQSGDALCLLGPNGAGKTSLLRCLLGRNRPTAGTVLIGGRDLALLSSREAAQEIAYVPQDVPNVFAYTALDIALTGRSPYVRPFSTPTRDDVGIAASALDMLGVGRLAGQPFAQLSGGERQLVLIARALAQRSRILLLDEPTAKLDYANQARILRTIRDLARRQYTVIMTSHAPDQAMLACNGVAVLKDRTVRLLGRPSDVIDEDLLSALYDTPVRVLKAALADGSDAGVAACIPLLDD